MRKILIVCLFSFLINLYANNGDNKSESLIYNWEFLIGQNYSEFTSTDCDGDFGMSISLYKRFNLKKKFSAKIGIATNKISSRVFDKTIRTTGNMGAGPYYLYDCSSIDFKFTFIEFNTFLQYEIYKLDKFSLNPIIGFGYCLSSKGNSKNRIENIIISDNKFLDSDYISFDESGSFFINSNIILHYGMNINFDRYFVKFYYTNHPHINYGDNSLKINEELHSFNFYFGFAFGK